MRLRPTEWCSEADFLSSQVAMVAVSVPGCRAVATALTGSGSGPGRSAASARHGPSGPAWPGFLHQTAGRHPPMHLWVIEYNETAVRFYERHGYKLTGVGELWRGKLPNVQSAASSDLPISHVGRARWRLASLAR
jgi:hypothetical protein